MLCIIDQSGKVVSRSRNLRGIREHAGKHVIERVEISRVGQWGGLIKIYFVNGWFFQTKYADYSILRNSVRNWRNLYGANLFIEGTPCGTVSYHNPRLK